MMMEDDQATAIGNVHKKLINIVRVVPKISLRTNTHTTYSSQYFVPLTGRSTGNKKRDKSNHFPVLI